MQVMLVIEKGPGEVYPSSSALNIKVTHRLSVYVECPTPEAHLGHA